MKLTCASCGKRYDYEEHESCPKCGAYNRPPAASDGPPASSGALLPEEPEFAREEERAARRSRVLSAVSWAAAVVVVVMAVLMGVISSRPQQTRMELSMPSAADPPPIWTPEKEAELSARMEELLASIRETMPPPAAVEAPPAAPAEEALEEALEAGTDEAPPEAGPDPARLATFTYGIEIGEAKGVTLTVNSAGPADLPELDALLLPGEKAIFLDFTAEITDPDAFGREFFQPPFVRVGQDGGRSLWPAAAELPDAFTPLDVDGMRDTDRTVTAGQLFFAVPEDCRTFMLHYGDPGADAYVQRLNV